MNSYDNKAQEDKSKSVAHNLFKRQANAKAPSQFADNRPETIAQRKLQQIINNNTLKTRQAVQPQAIQRQELTEEEVKKALAERAPAFAGKPYKIIKHWDTDFENNSNCHGFTKTKNTGAFVYPDAIVSYLIESNENALVFIKGGAVAHSGLWDGAKLTHLLIGIGILESTIDGDKAGYDDRYVLPDQMQELKELVGYKDKTPESEFNNLKDMIKLFASYAEQDEKIDTKKSPWKERLAQIDGLKYSEENQKMLDEWYSEL